LKVSGDVGRLVIADSACVSQSQPDVSAFSPTCSPGVLDLVVAACDANEQDVVVEFLLAVAEDTLLIMTPVCCVSRYTNGSALEGVHDVGASLGLEVLAYLKISLVDNAMAIVPFIGVGRFGSYSMVLDVVESIVVGSSSAAEVAIFPGAVDQLLLGKDIMTPMHQRP
jgi:hypothetical protein